jgi:hypothetical protein
MASIAFRSPQLAKNMAHVPIRTANVTIRKAQPTIRLPSEKKNLANIARRTTQVTIRSPRFRKSGPSTGKNLPRDSTNRTKFRLDEKKEAKSDCREDRHILTRQPTINRNGKRPRQ